MKAIRIIMILALTFLSTISIVSCGGNESPPDHKKEPPAEHEHEYSYSWRKDENNHWRECACADRTDIGTHTFDDWASMDNAMGEVISSHCCTVCGYTETEVVTKPNEPDDDRFDLPEIGLT